MADTAHSPHTRPPVLHERSSSSIHASDDANRTSTASSRAQHSQNGQHHGYHAHKKQFLVSTRHTHGHAHTRVPSHGRNMSKLAGQGGSRTNLNVNATSPKNDKDGSERRHQRQMKPKFEIGTPEDEEVEEVDEDEDGFQDVPQRREPQRSRSQNGIYREHNDGVVGMKKSASMRGFESKDRKGRSERKVHERRQSGEREKREKRRSSDQLGANGQSRGNAEQNPPAPSQPTEDEQEAVAGRAPQPPPPTAHAHGVPPQFQPTTNTRPLSPQESGGPVIATNISQPSHTVHRTSHTSRTPHTPVTPAHSLPSSQEQPLTSRFIHSPSSAAESTITRRGDNVSQTPPGHSSQIHPAGITHSESMHSINKPTSSTSSRTQKKLWLQRQSSQQEMPESMFHGLNASPSPGEYYLLQSRAQREFERVAKEYMNVRRFRHPIADGLERIRSKSGKRRVIPKRTASGDAAIAGTLGLSQSLKEAGEMRRGGTKSAAPGVSIDDARVEEGRREEDSRQTEVEQILRRLWKRGEMLESNE